MTPNSWVGIPLFLLLIAPGLLFDVLTRRRRAVPGESAFHEASRVVLASTVFTGAGLLLWLTVRALRPSLTVDPAALIRPGASAYAADNLLRLVFNVVGVATVGLLLAWGFDRYAGRGQARLAQHSTWREVFREDLPQGCYSLARVALGDGSVWTGRVHDYTPDLATEGRELTLGPPLFSGADSQTPLHEWSRIVVKGEDISSIVVMYPLDLPEAPAAPDAPQAESAWAAVRPSADLSRTSPRLAWLIDPWVLRAALIASVLGILWATWASGTVARWFVALAGATAALATMPGLGRVGLRRARFSAGAISASAGAVLTLQLGFMVERHAANDSQGFGGALALALLVAAFGGWIAEERLERIAVQDAQRQDQLAAERHAQLLDAAGVGSASAAADPPGRASRRGRRAPGPLRARTRRPAR